MKRLKLLTLLLVLVITSSCRTVGVFFEKETPDIVSSVDERIFYKNVKSFEIKSANQTVVYSSGQLSSGINVLIATMEKRFISNGYPVKKENPDVLIEVVSIDAIPYATNQVEKRNGDTRKYANCTFSYQGLKAFIKVTRGTSVIHYTYHHTPCTREKGGCWGKIDRDCHINPIVTRTGEIPAYQIGSKENPLWIEQIANEIAVDILGNIK